VEPQQAAPVVEPPPTASMTVATTVVAVAAPPTLPVPAAAGSPGAAVVEIPDDDDVPPPGWDQWASAPVSAPEGSAGGSRGPRRRRHDAGAPIQWRWGLVFARWTRARLEQEGEHADAPPAHFIEAQEEQGLWQELRDHDASLNRALNEALRIHNGPAWRVFQVSRASWGFRIPSLAFSAFVFFLMLALLASLAGGRSWSTGLASGTTPSTASTPTFSGTGVSTRPWTLSSRP
jgi:hypothetical protein